MRPAFTLVELLVAIVILAVGVLALAATAGLVAAHIGDGARLTGAAHVARTVLDSLGGRDCAAITTGASSRDGISDRVDRRGRFGRNTRRADGRRAAASHQPS